MKFKRELRLSVDDVLTICSRQSQLLAKLLFLRLEFLLLLEDRSLLVYDFFEPSLDRFGRLSSMAGKREVSSMVVSEGPRIAMTTDPEPHRAPSPPIPARDKLDG